MKCKSYIPDQVDGCEHLNVEVYSAGVSRYCREYGKDIYYIKNCPCRPTYSDDSVTIKSDTKRTPK